MRDSFNEINITPLTDIFLVLLIIMMVICLMFDEVIGALLFGVAVLIQNSLNVILSKIFNKRKGKKI